MLRCGIVPAKYFNGHSHATPSRPIRRLSICRTGTGLTAPSRFFVQVSQNIFGQMKASIALPTWSGFDSKR